MAAPISSHSSSAGKSKGVKVSMRYAWYALFVLFMVNMFNYVDRMSINTAMETLKRYFEINDTKLGLIASSFTLVYAIISLPMGFLSDRGTRTRIIAAGAFVWSLATTASGFMRSYWPFFTSRALVGAGEGIYAPSGNAVIVDYFPKSMRNRVIAIFMSAMILGGAISFIVAGLILKKTEHFDMKRLDKLVASKQHEAIPGWSFEKSNEIKNPESGKRMAVYHFKSADGAELALGLQRFDDKKSEAEKRNVNVLGSSLLFDFHALRDGKIQEAKDLDADARKLSASVIMRIKEHEADPIGNNHFGLKRLSSRFHIPPEYKGRLWFDDAEKELVFKGVMTKKDKNKLMALSEAEDYQKAIGIMHSDSNFYYVRSDNWKWIFWILGPPGLLIALMTFFLKEPIKGGGEDFLTEEQARNADNAVKPDYKLIFKTPSVVILMISNTLATYCVGGLVTWLFPYVERYKGMESADAAIRIGPFVIFASLAGVIVSGILADKLAKRMETGNNLLLVIAILLGTPFMYIFFVTTNYWLMVISISLTMFFLTWLNGPLNAMLMSLVEPQLRATLNAIHILLIHLLGDALSPLVIGYMSDKKSLHFALMITPVFLVLAMFGFGIAGAFVSKDFKAMEQRMKNAAA